MSKARKRDIDEGNINNVLRKLAWEGIKKAIKFDILQILPAYSIELTPESGAPLGSLEGL